MFAAVIVALVVGAMVGAGLATARSRRGSLGGEPTAVAPVVEHEPEPEVPSSLGPLLHAAVDRLDLAVVICDADGGIVFRNAPASALAGTHVGVLLDSHVDDVLANARVDGRIEKRVDLHGPPRTSLLLVAEPTGDGSAVVTIEDVSERERTDAMRTDFVANISHELKTPVGAIAVLADALEDETHGGTPRRSGC